MMLRTHQHAWRTGSLEAAQLFAGQNRAAGRLVDPGLVTR
jgi:hypothetical protein